MAQNRAEAPQKKKKKRFGGCSALIVFTHLNSSVELVVSPVPQRYCVCPTEQVSWVPTERDDEGVTVLQGAKASPLVVRAKVRRMGLRNEPLKTFVGFPAVSELGYYLAVIV